MQSHKENIYDFSKPEIKNASLDNQQSIARIERKYFGIIDTKNQKRVEKIGGEIDFLINIIEFKDIYSASLNNQVNYETRKIWLTNLFFLLRNLEDEYTFKETIYADLFCIYKHKNNDNEIFNVDKEYDKFYICLISDSNKVQAFYLGNEKPSAEKIYLKLKDHIEENSRIICGKLNYFSKLISELKLSKINKQIEIKIENKTQLKLLSKFKSELRALYKFLGVHTYIDKNNIQNYLNLFSFICSDPLDKFEKIDYMLSSLKKINNTKYLSSCYQISQLIY